MPKKQKKQVPVQKNQEIELEITGVTQEGSGVGHWQGLAVFVPMTAPGDRILAKVVKVRARHAYGICLQVLQPSPHRAADDCPVYAQCGGCSLRHLDYEEELRVKEGWVRENLRRIGGVELELEPIIPSPRQSRYRNKAQYPVGLREGRVVAGFFAKRSHRLIPAGDCLLQPQLFRDLTALICDFLQEFAIPPYEEQKHTGLVRHIFLRHAEGTGQVMVCLVINGGELPHWEILLERLRKICPGLATLVLNHNTSPTNVILGNGDTALWGSGIITDRLCHLDIALSTRSFYQVNREAAQLLYRQALEYAAPTGDELLLDLYCGAGAIGLSMAHRAGQVIGVEVVEPAVNDARRNAAANGIENARFLCADAAQGALQLREEGLAPDILVVDPPRKGLSEEAVAHSAAMGPRRLVYISCDSATLARDLARFAPLGYQAVRGRAVDLFPRTTHVEAVVLLERTCGKA